MLGLVLEIYEEGKDYKVGEKYILHTGAHKIGVMIVAVGDINEAKVIMYSES